MDKKVPFYIKKAVTHIDLGHKIVQKKEKLGRNEDVLLYCDAFRYTWKFPLSTEIKASLTVSGVVEEELLCDCAFHKIKEHVKCSGLQV